MKKRKQKIKEQMRKKNKGKNLGLKDWEIGLMS